MKLLIPLIALLCSTVSQARIEAIECLDLMNEVSYALKLNDNSWWSFEIGNEPNKVSCDLSSDQMKIECVENTYNTHVYTLDLPDEIQFLSQFFDATLQPFYGDGATAGEKIAVECEAYEQPHTDDLHL